MINVQNLSKSYGRRAAVRGLTFEVEAGEVVGFLGPNGAGKSTTLRMLTGFLTPNSGTIEIGEVDALAHPIEARRQIGYMPESCPLYRDMRVVEYLAYRAQLKGVGRSARPEAVDKAMGQAAITDVSQRIIGQLSKGYRQRVGLADALVGDPPLLILDEPTAGLDPNQIRQVRELIQELAQDKTVFLSTHILPEVESLCDRVLILHQGTLVGEGEPATLRGNLAGTQVVHFEARGSAKAIEEALTEVDEARAVKVTPVSGEGATAIVRGRVEMPDRPDTVEAVFLGLLEAEAVLRELRRQSASLEDVFTQLTTAESGEAPAQVEAAAESEDDPEDADLAALPDAPDDANETDADKTDDDETEGES